MSNTINLIESDIPFEYEKETKIRDHYADNLGDLRKKEVLIGREVKTHNHNLSIDMLTVDHKNTIRVWEFKLTADYSAIGQLIVYMALKKQETGGTRRIKGVIAAVNIPDFISESINMSLLDIELVEIPKTIINCGLPPYQQCNTKVEINYPKENVNV